MFALVRPAGQVLMPTEQDRCKHCESFSRNGHPCPRLKGAMLRNLRDGMHLEVLHCPDFCGSLGK
jgi:hypothetical protein